MTYLIAYTRAIDTGSYRTIEIEASSEAEARKALKARFKTAKVFWIKEA